MNPDDLLPPTATSLPAPQDAPTPPTATPAPAAAATAPPLMVTPQSAGTLDKAIETLQKGVAELKAAREQLAVAPPPPAPTPAPTPPAPAVSLQPAALPDPASHPPIDTAATSAGLIALLTVFVLALFVGKEIITKVPPTLHTPLMSGTNAISGITLVGAVLSCQYEEPALAAIFAFLAITLASINVVGGYRVTHRMLAMFKARR